MNFVKFLLVAVIASPVFSQISWKISTESGIFNSTNSIAADYNELLLRLDSQLKYEYSDSLQNAAVTVRWRPEIFGISGDNIRSSKSHITGEYRYQYKKKYLDIKIKKQLNNYSNAVNDLNQDITYLTLGITTPFKENIFFALNPGYAYQYYKSGIRQNTDFYFLNMTMYFYPKPNINYFTGIYTERFHIEQRRLYLLNRIETKNNGYRYGPEFGFSYIKNFLCNIEYRFLLHDSRATTYPSFENWLRLMLIKSLNKKITLYFLVDIFDRNFKTKQNWDALYTTVNLENQIYFKLSYQIRSAIDCYLKCGYFRENLLLDNPNLSGWNVLAGISVRNI